MASTEFEKWRQKWPNGSVQRSEQIKLAKELIDEATSADVHEPPGERRMTHRDCPVTDPCDETENSGLVQWKGISVGWLLTVFLNFPEVARMVEFGCEMWFFRNICITEILRRRGVTSGPLIDHIHALNQDDTSISQQHGIGAADSNEAAPSGPDCLADKENATREIASCFVSYTGAYTLRHFFDLLRQSLPDHFIWMDVFCVDQFAWTERTADEDVMHFKGNFMYELGSKIKTIGRTTLFLDKWDRIMDTVGQIWVLWEIFSTVASDAEFSVALSAEESTRFVSIGLGGSENEFAKIMDSLATIDANKAEAWNPDDKDLILGMMKESGVFNVNCRLTEEMRKWLGLVGQQHLDKVRREKHDEYAAAFAGNLALLYVDLGRFDEASHLCREALGWEIENHKAGAKSNTILNATVIMCHQGKFHDAEKQFERLYDERRRRLGEDDKETLAAAGNLACVLKNIGKYAQAEALFRHLLEKEKIIYGEDDIQTIRAINNLATLKMEQGEYSEAESLFEKALDGMRRHRQDGNRHPDTLKQIHNMAGAFYKRGKLDDAEKLYREAWTGRQQQLGRDNPETLETKNNLASVLAKSEVGIAEAKDLFLEVVEARREAIGAEHPDTLDSVQNLANVLTGLGRFKEAMAFHQEALSGFTNQFTNRDHRTLTVMHNIAILFAVQGLWERAKSVCQLAFDGRVATLGPDHPDTVATKSLLQDIQEDMLRRNANTGIR